MDDLEILARGWMARVELDRHAELRAGIPVLDRVVVTCMPCNRATAAWLRGESLERIESLFCEMAKNLRAEIKAADEVARRVTGA